MKYKNNYKYMILKNGIYFSSYIGITTACLHYAYDVTSAQT